jgi:SnoaL-like domain
MRKHACVSAPSAEPEKAVEFMERFYEERGRVKAGTPEWERFMCAYHHPDVVFRPLRGFTDVDETHGIDAFIDWLRSYFSVWTDWRYELREIEELDQRLLVHGHMAGRGRGSGLEIGGEIFELVELRDGLIATVEHHGTRAGALRAAGAA